MVRPLRCLCWPAGRLQTDLGYPANYGDDVYLYNVTNNNYTVYSYYGANGWSPSEPWIGLGQAFVLVPNTNNTYTWPRQFTTCQ